MAVVDLCRATPSRFGFARPRWIRAPPGLISEERARLPQPHNERCHQHDDGECQQKPIP